MKKILLLIICIGVVTLSACQGETENSSLSSVAITSNAEAAEATFSKTDADMFSDRDLDHSFNQNAAISIRLSGGFAAASDKSVNISGTTVTVTKEATYIVEGSLSNGSLVVNAPKTAKIQLILNGATINNSSTAPLFIKSCDKVFLTVVNDTVNHLTVSSFSKPAESGIDGGIYSKSDLTINGAGKLNISSKTGHGIVAKDDLAIVGGDLNITSANHGINANDSAKIKNANITVKSGKDGIHAENTEDTEKGFVYINGGNFNITSEGDGISASSSLQYISGDTKITAGGGYENGTKEHSDNFGHFGGRPDDISPGRREFTGMSLTAENTDNSSTSMKGIKSGGSMLISRGNISVNSADDSIHSNDSLTVSGGSFNLKSGDDGLHADNTVTVSNGNIIISESYEGIEGLHIKILGGEITLKSEDDGFNAAGGNDSSGTEGGRDGMFGKPGPGGMSGNSNGSVIISGGKISITANGDGIDANGTVEITGGKTTVTGPTTGDTATLDYDKNCIISGGTFIGTGARNMAQSFSDNSQGVIAISVGNTLARTKITLNNSEGNLIISHSPTLDFNVIILSSPDIESGEEYSITVGDYIDTVTAQ